MITKFRFATVLSLLALTVVIYSACQKETKQTDTNPNNDAEIAKTIAVGLYNSFGATIASQSALTGLPAVTTVRNGIKVNGLTCGQVINQPYSFTHTGTGTQDVMNGANKFVISCEGSQPNGYAYTGSYVNTGFNASTTYDITVKEHYTLKSLAPEFAKMQVDGSQVSVYKTVTKKDNEAMNQANTYTLAGLIIDSSSRPFDITAGTATFVSKGTNAGRNFNFAGTIEFLGGHKAKVSFGGKSFDIEIL